MNCATAQDTAILRSLQVVTESSLASAGTPWSAPQFGDPEALPAMTRVPRKGRLEAEGVQANFAKGALLRVIA